MRCLTSLLFFLLTLTAAAQVKPPRREVIELPPESLEQASGYDLRNAKLPAGGPVALLEFTVEPGSTKGNVFDVVTTVGGVPVSLVLPNGTEITSANASASGFTFETVEEGSFEDSETPSPLSLPGTHTLIELPVGAAPGIYRVKVDGRSLTAEAGVIATHMASSQVRAHLLSNQDDYRTGDTVILTGAAFDNTAPILAATVTALVSLRGPLAGPVTVGSYQQVAARPISAIETEYEYRASVAGQSARRRTSWRGSRACRRASRLRRANWCSAT